MKNSLLIVIAALICLFAVSCHAEESTKATSLEESVMLNAIGLMPAKQKDKLTAVKNEILAAAIPVPSADGKTDEIYYFIDTKTGSGPLIMADQFIIALKGVGDGLSYTELSPALGKILACVTALSQPYHTSETLFKDPTHAEFEKGLAASAPSIKAKLDKYEKVPGTSDYAVKIAQKAHDLLQDPGAKDKEALNKAVYALAVNGVTDYWWTLLVPNNSNKSTISGISSEPKPEGPVNSERFIGNKKSHKFHLAKCRFLPSEGNRIYFKSRDEAISQGYTPCKVCKP